MNVSLDDLKRLAQELPRLPDTRPTWLKAMPYVTQEGSDYYRFIFELVKCHRPARILEIGIDKAGSTMSLAAANPSGQVVSMDISREACENAGRTAQAHGLQNLTIRCQNSLELGFESSWPKIDLLFLDSWHSFDQVYREYVMYRKVVNPGGIILFDDIRYSKEMAVAWDYIMDPKVDLSELHHSGFGACKVDSARRPPSWESVTEEAKKKYS